MSVDERVIERGNEVFGIEVRGFDHIPEAERNMTLRHVDDLWVGSSVNLLAFALGAIAISLGLSLWVAFAACLLGNLTYAYNSYGSVVTARAGLPVSTVARAAFGVRGNLPNAVLCWVSSVAFEVINTIFGVEALLALFDVLGWKDAGSAGKFLAVLLQLLLCGGIAALGHATMVWFQRLFAAVIGTALLVVIAFTVGKVDWARAGVPHGHLVSLTTGAAFLTASGIIAANPMSFLFNGPDWVRYLPSTMPARPIFWRVFWASFVPTVLVTMMGSFCATLGDMEDPVAGMKPFMPPWLFIIYIFAVVGGSIASNVPTYYSSGLTLQAIGLKLHRYAATLLDAVVSTVIALYILFVYDFTTALNNFVALLIVWVGPFGGVWVCDGYLRRGHYDSRGIHSHEGAGGRYWGWHGLNPLGYAAIAVGMTVAAMTMMSPLYNGPVAVALGGADLSWILGFSRVRRDLLAADDAVFEACAAVMPETVAYRVLTAAEAVTLESGVFEGSALDRADGFIHLSTAAQLTHTVNVHFAGQGNLAIAVVDLEVLGAAVRWESSRDGELFPHLYAPLTAHAVLALGPLQRAADGTVRCS